MAQYRKFWITNASGVQYNLTDTNSKGFLNSPTGLGFNKALTKTRLGNEETNIIEQASFPTISGELIFNDKSNASIYTDYQAFIQFVKIKPLKLYYQTPNTFGSWYIDCTIVSMEKSEISDDGLLHCPISISGHSFWKTAQENDVVVTNIESVGKEYPYTYPYTYGGNSYANINLTNNGTLDCGFTLLIEDEITNPILSLYQTIDGQDTKYGEIKILGTYDYVRVDTRDTSQEIYLEYQDSVIANPTAYFDLTGNGSYSTPFPKLKVGENKLTFAFGGTFTQPVHIKWRDIYLTE